MSNKANARVLIADDYEFTRKTLKALIETRPGWQICGEADNGHQAIQKASELRPDVIVLDLRMPVLDGLAAARVITEAMPTVPVLIYTLYVTADLAVEAKKAGIRLIIDKAGTYGKLLTAMESLLSVENRHQVAKSGSMASAATIQ
jgi:DNA-binding NarL/FixJ family response regulator